METLEKTFLELGDTGSNSTSFIADRLQILENSSAELNITLGYLLAQWNGSKLLEIDSGEKCITLERKLNVTDEKVKSMERKLENVVATGGSRVSNHLSTVRPVIEALKTEFQLEMSNVDEKVSSFGERAISMRATQRVLESGLAALITDTNTFVKPRLNNLAKVIAAATNVRGFWNSAKVELFYSRGQNGRTETIDFTDCTNTYQSCCRNLVALDLNAEALNTHGSCVILHQMQNCIGPYTVFYPGSGNDQNDFGSSRNKFRSISTCY